MNDEINQEIESSYSFGGKSEINQVEGIFDDPLIKTNPPDPTTHHSAKHADPLDYPSNFDQNGHTPDDSSNNFQDSNNFKESNNFDFDLSPEYRQSTTSKPITTSIFSNKQSKIQNSTNHFSQGTISQNALENLHPTDIPTHHTKHQIFNTEEHGYFFLVLQEFFILFIALVLLNRYGNIKKLCKTRGGTIICCSVWFSWFFALNVILLLPLDISVSLFKQCQVEMDVVNCGRPWNYVSPPGIKQLWRIVYWGSFLMSWVVLPFLQSYNNSGHFTTAGRLRTAVVNNALYYLSLLVIIVVLLVYLIAHHKISILNLRSVLIAAINTWGMVFLVLLAGFGLVSLPRTWYEERDIRRTYFRFSNLNDDKSLNNSELKEISSEIKQFSMRVSPQHPILKWRMNEIIRKLPISIQNEINQASINEQGGVVGRQDTGKDVSSNDLVKIHKRLLKALSAKARIQALWLQALEKAILHEDIQYNKKSGESIWRPRYSSLQLTHNAKWDYYWYCHLRDKAYMVVFYMLCLASGSVVLSECTFFIQKYPISPFAAGVEFLDNYKSYLLVEVLSSFIVSYIALSAYYTLFNLKFFNIFYIAPNKLTDANSLLFLGIMLCRLTASISLNVLSMIHMDSHILDVKKEVQTQFTNFMGHFDVLAPVRAKIYMILPSLIILITLATYKKVGTKIANSIGFFQFLDPSDGIDSDVEGRLSSDNFTNDIINMGKELVKMELKKKVKLKERESDSGSRLGGDSSAVRSTTSFLGDLGSFTRGVTQRSKGYSRVQGEEERTGLLESSDGGRIDDDSGRIDDVQNEAQNSKSFFDDI